MSASQTWLHSNVAACKQLKQRGSCSLLSFTSLEQVRDMTGREEVTKRRIKEGVGEFPVDCPLEDCAVRVHFTARAVGAEQVSLSSPAPFPRITFSALCLTHMGCIGRKAGLGAHAASCTWGVCRETCEDV